MNRRHLFALIAVAGMAAVPGLAQAQESLGTEIGYDVHGGNSHFGESGRDDHSGESRYGETRYDNHGGERHHDEAGQEHNLGLDD